MRCVVKDLAATAVLDACNARSSGVALAGTIADRHCAHAELTGRYTRSATSLALTPSHLSWFPVSPLRSNPKLTRGQVMAEWLGKFDFTHFITLTTHDPSLGRDSLRDLVRQWDARVNRAVFGPKWHKHPDELLWSFAFLEKPDSNPHWHVLTRLNGLDPDKRDEQTHRLIEAAHVEWKRLVPSGTVNVQEIIHDRDRVARYVAKDLDRVVQWSEFITPDEFRLG